jgi:thymidylate kinase
MFLIYISGIDGCGKTTQAKLLVDGLTNAGFDTEYLWMRWEPSVKKGINLVKSLRLKRTESSYTLTEKENHRESNWLEFKKKLLLNPVLRYMWMLYACNDYYHSCRKKMCAQSSQIIVCDRYLYDFAIDQAVNFGIPPEKLINIVSDTRLSKLKMPNLKLIIDIPAGEGYRRKMDGTPLNYLETRMSYYQRGFEEKNAMHFNGMKSIQGLASEILNYVLPLLDGENFEK